MQYEDSNLLSGSLDALVEKLTPTENHYADRAFLFAFLLSSRLYIRPHELLGKIFSKSFPLTFSTSSASSSSGTSSQNQRHYTNQRHVSFFLHILYVSTTYNIVLSAYFFYLIFHLWIHAQNLKSTFQIPNRAPFCVDSRFCHLLLIFNC